MTVFWLVAAALVGVVVLALLRPLLRRTAVRSPEGAATNVAILREQRAELEAEHAAGMLDDTAFASARAELDRRVLEESVAPAAPGTDAGRRSGAIAVALLVPVIAIGLYAQLGNRGALDPVLAKTPANATEQDVETLIQRLAQRMREQPGDPEGWALLGRVYSGTQRFELAREAYAQAVALRPGDAQLLADYADALAMTQGGTLLGPPQALIEQALQADPRNAKALALAGSAAMEQRDFTQAIDHWTQARALAPAGSPFAISMDQAIADARAAGGLPAEGPVAASPPAAGASAVAGTVTLAPELLARVRSGDTLFVFARAADGPRMPLAIQRGTVGQWPVSFTLDDTMAMSPSLKLSAFGRVVVGARISRTGDATPQPGDLEGQSAPLTPDGTPVTVRIDRIRD